jgi:glycosidase
VIKRIFFIVLGIWISLNWGFAQEPQTDILKNLSFGKPAIKSADWVKDAIIYCVYLRSFSPEGTFVALEKRIPELKDFGVSAILLMPIHPVGIKNRKGKLGSPYSVRDYYTTNPEFGTIVDFQKLLNTAHKNNMKMVIDLVADRTSWDSKLIIQHPEWFTKDANGNIISPRPEWTDVADLNYSKTGLRKYILEMMEWWIRDIGVDGFRCDFAELVPIDFWEEARERLDKIKPVVMISDGSLSEHHLKAFDITCSKNLYDELDSLLEGKQSAMIIDKILHDEYQRFPTGSLQVRFCTNQDNDDWDTPPALRLGMIGLKLAAVLVNTMPGIPLIYNGEEAANDKRLSLTEKIDIDWNGSPEMDSLFGALFKLRNEHKALSRGKLVKVSTTNEKEGYCFFRIEGNDKVFVALNFSKESRTIDLDIPFDEIFPKKQKVRMKDIFTGASITFEHGKTRSITLEQHGYLIFVLDK